MSEIPEYGTMNGEELGKAFFSFLDEIESNISNFILTNGSKISDIYATIKDGGAKKKVSIIDLNLLFHSYEEYLEDMIKFITSDDTQEKLAKASNGKDVSDALLKMRDQDKNFFDNVATSDFEMISDAMKNIEILIDMKEFIQKAREKFTELSSEQNIEFIRLFVSSISTFCDKLFQAVINSFEIIRATLDGTLAQSESNKEVQYKMF